MSHIEDTVTRQQNNPDLWIEPQTYLEQNLQFELRRLHRQIISRVPSFEKQDEMTARATQWDKNPRNRLA